VQINRTKEERSASFEARSAQREIYLMRSPRNEGSIIVTIVFILCCSHRDPFSSLTILRPSGVSGNKALDPDGVLARRRK